jgi:hypothetical protein
MTNESDKEAMITCMLQEALSQLKKLGRDSVYTPEKRFYGAIQKLKEIFIYNPSILRGSDIDQLMETLIDYPATLRRLLDAQDAVVYYQSRLREESSRRAFIKHPDSQKEK